MPQPIEIEIFRPDAASVVPGLIGFVGRFDDPRKNLELFLDAMKSARSGGADLRAEVIGGEPEGGHLEAVDRRGLAGVVNFVPYLEPARLAERLRRLDLVCVTSHQEGLGIAALEAMACGCPLVATRCGGPEEYVRDGEAGFLAGFSAAEISSHILTIVEDRGLRESLARSARAIIEARYSWAAVREIFGAALDDLEMAETKRNFR